MYTLYYMHFLGVSGGGCGNPLQYSCLENPHGQRSLEGSSPSGRQESDTTEPLSTQGTQRQVPLTNEVVRQELKGKSLCFCVCLRE